MFTLVLFILAKAKSVLGANLQHVALSLWTLTEFALCFLGGMLGHEEFFMQFY